MEKSHYTNIYNYGNTAFSGTQTHELTQYFVRNIHMFIVM